MNCIVLISSTINMVFHQLSADGILSYQQLIVDGVLSAVDSRKSREISRRNQVCAVRSRYKWSSVPSAVDNWWSSVLSAVDSRCISVPSAVDTIDSWWSRMLSAVGSISSVLSGSWWSRVLSAVDNWWSIHVLSTVDVQLMCYRQWIVNEEVCHQL